jgi:hypothetical protein
MQILVYSFYVLGKKKELKLLSPRCVVWSTTQQQAKKNNNNKKKKKKTQDGRVK